MKAKQIRLGLVVVVCCLAGCGGLASAPLANAGASGDRATDAVLAEREIDWEALDEQIRLADGAIDPHFEGHADLAPMRALLEGYAGDLEMLCYVCEHMDHKAHYCWTRASHLNPELRDDLCGRMVEHIGDYYEEDCRGGAPHFVY